MPRRPSILVQDLQPGQIVPAHVHACASCQRLFLGSADAVYCCNACRMAAARNSRVAE